MLRNADRVVAWDPVRRLGGLAYGGDYNPEQWPPSTWREDVALMREAGVTLVTVGVFSWALLEPLPGEYDFGWLDEVLGLLHAGGIAVDLATATASPPPWLAARYPDSLPVTADGRRLWPGSRQAYCPSSPDYRRHAAALVHRLASRYAGHPALAMWHVGNEYGCHVSRCWCDPSAAAFRRWLQRRYGTGAAGLDRLNTAWATAFWSQHYADWEHVLPPRATPSFGNPTQQLDFRRFSSDELLDCFRLERDLLRRHTPDVPVTTNFMVAEFGELDYTAWAAEVDVVSNDHYLRADVQPSHVDLALAGDVSRGLGGGAPWLLMEHSTSAVNWQPRNLAKAPGQLRRNSLGHVARGSDGAMFFQWRASAGGAEKFHSAMLPHAGTDTKVWREVVELGGELGRLAEVAGSRVEAPVALLWDYQSWWAQEAGPRPSVDMTFLAEVRAWHHALWWAGLAVDPVHPESDLSGYRLLLAPALYLVGDAAAANVASTVEAGAALLVGPYSGIVDGDDHVRPGGYPGAFADLLGVRTEEFFPLPAGATVRLSGGPAEGGSGRVWTELCHPAGAEVVSRYVDGPLPGEPALTVRRGAGGPAWYLTTRLAEQTLAAVLGRLCAEAGVAPPVAAPPGVEVVRRRGEGRSFLFVIDHTGRGASLSGCGTDLLTGRTYAGTLDVPAGGVVVLREDAAGEGEG